MNRRIIAIIGVVLLSIVLFACQPAPKPTAAVVEVMGELTETVTPSATEVGTATETTTPTRTVSPTYPFKTPNTQTPTPTMTSAFTPYPTIDWDNFNTSTPAQPAQCPVASGDAPEPFFLTTSFAELGETPEEEILAYLNFYGLAPIQQMYEQGILFEDFTGVHAIEDLTNDGIPEIVMKVGDLYIFGCQEGEYKTLLKQNSIINTGCDLEFLLEILDANQNGVPEIILQNGVHSWCFRDFMLLEWNGMEFRNINKKQSSIIICDECLYHESNGNVYFSEYDQDGILELLVDPGFPLDPKWYYMDFPWRHETNIYEWDGYYYITSETYFSEPEYRYQAVQDADDLMGGGEYDLALHLYQEVIFSDKLRGWSSEQKEYLQGIVWGTNGDAEFPSDDPDEYYYLAAYARYRIMLIHILEGRLDAAVIVYTTLQDYFPEGMPGYEFAEIANAFWLDYKVNKDMKSACNEALKLVDGWGYLLEYISPWYGNEYQDRRYLPINICKWGTWGWIDE